VLGITPGVDIRDLMKSLKINSKDRQYNGQKKWTKGQVMIYKN
jgi:hypothetical protein